MSEALEPHLNYADYLALEATAEHKHDFVRGHVYAMAGGSRAHNRIAMQVAGELYVALAQTPCRPVGSDQRVRIRSAELACYPDVTVVCGDDEPDADDNDAIVNPVVVIEVLSKSKEAYDRGEKFAALRELPSLRQFVLLHQTRQHAEVFTRQDDGTWRLSFHGDILPLGAIGAELDLVRVYAGVGHEAGDDDPAA